MKPHAAVLHPLFLVFYSLFQMMMGSTAKQEGVLKLVHPGRFVEIHRQPITAADVLKKNPRHSVARPDVFEFPWIVVRPEAVLHPGKVFLIVPNHTIYKLLKAHREKNKLAHQDTVHKEAQIQNPKRNSDAGMTPKCTNQNSWFKKSRLSTFCIGGNFVERDSGDRLRKQSKVDACPDEISSCIRNNHSDSATEDSTTMPRPFHHKDNYPSDNSLLAIVPRNNNNNLVSKSGKDISNLKSCLRKQDSVRKSLKLKVSFALPSEDEEHKRRDREFAGHYSRRFS